MPNYLSEYFCSPDNFTRIIQDGGVKNGSGYFRFGEEVCYGQCADIDLANMPNGSMQNALQNAKIQGNSISLPFDLAEIVNNLRNELYVKDSIFRSPTTAAAAKAYYLIRPILSVSVRKYIQRIRLVDWDKVPFPHWPVDVTVDNLFAHLMLMNLDSQKVDRIPFIWFWPDGANSCAIMTHDVETTEGRDYCSKLMSINDRYGIKSSFQVVPERRYEVPESYLQEIRDRNFEINVQDLNHDGRLYRERKTFLKRIEKINEYGRQWQANGFRAAVLYRRQNWFDSLQFSYDMSVPNVSPLDPQRGGCCTVMPYFIGDILELPVTTTQDYSLFHVLNQYSLDLWKQQCELIMKKHGMMSFIMHPDYIITSREKQIYEDLLEYLAQLRDERNVWLPKPGEVNDWWRQRSKMRLVEEDGEWRIEGLGHERARVAYASKQDGKLAISFDSSPTAVPVVAARDRE